MARLRYKIIDSKGKIIKTTTSRIEAEKKAKEIKGEFRTYP